jgi:hypothetical protein
VAFPKNAGSPQFFTKAGKSQGDQMGGFYERLRRDEFSPAGCFMADQGDPPKIAHRRPAAAARAGAGERFAAQAIG